MRKKRLPRAAEMRRNCRYNRAVLERQIEEEKRKLSQIR